MGYTTDVQGYIKRIPKMVLKEAKARGKEASREIKIVTRETLQGARSGRVYGGHVASAPGEAPAKWSGNLRNSFCQKVEVEGMTIKPGVQSGVEYASFLEDGTSRMATRPYRERILRNAFPKVFEIYSRPYFGDV